VQSAGLHHNLAASRAACPIRRHTDTARKRKKTCAAIRFGSCSGHCRAHIIQLELLPGSRMAVCWQLSLLASPCAITPCCSCLAPQLAAACGTLPVLSARISRQELHTYGSDCALMPSPVSSCQVPTSSCKAPVRPPNAGAWRVRWPRRWSTCWGLGCLLHERF
jgi:hypothetical protein